MKKILITGSAGFIAPHIAEQALNLGWQVIGVDTEEVEDKISDKRIKYIKSDLLSVPLEYCRYIKDLSLKATFLSSTCTLEGLACLKCFTISL